MCGADSVRSGTSDCEWCNASLFALIMDFIYVSLGAGDQTAIIVSAPKSGRHSCHGNPNLAAILDSENPNQPVSFLPRKPDQTAIVIAETPDQPAIVVTEKQSQTAIIASAQTPYARYQISVEL